MRLLLEKIDNNPWAVIIPLIVIIVGSLAVISATTNITECNGVIVQDVFGIFRCIES